MRVHFHVLGNYDGIFILYYNKIITNEISQMLHMKIKFYIHNKKFAKREQLTK